MHRAKGGLHIVDIVTNFTIPDNKDQAYVIDEIIEKVYFFKVWVLAKPELTSFDAVQNMDAEELLKISQVTDLKILL